MTVRGRRIQLLRDKIASKDMLVNREEDDDVNDGDDDNDDDFERMTLYWRLFQLVYIYASTSQWWW